LRLFLKNFKKSPAVLLSSLNPFKHGKTALSLNLFYTVLPFAQRKYDIIQCHYGPNGVLGAFVKKAGVGRKLVTMFHGYDIRRGKKGWGSYADLLIEEGDCFLYYTEYAFGLLAACGIDSRKLVSHRIGIDPNLFKRSGQSKDRNPSETLTILTVARLVEEKALHYGIRAVAELMNRKPELSIQYHIIGEGYLENQLKDLIKELNLEKSVFMLGGMSREEVIQEMVDADIFLLPSQEETLGTVLLEAQAMEMPVIGTRVGGLTETVNDGESGFLVPAKDVDAMVECLSILIGQPHTWRQIGRKGRAHVENNYDVKLLNSRLVQIYKSLLNTKTENCTSRENAIQPYETSSAN
jgi:colanic acid/amylovoran biosynthesis glycosyltransferase